MPEDNARFTGIQVKKGNIDAKVGKSKAPPALESQIQQAFAKPVGPPNKEPYTRITTLVICATGRIAPKARSHLESGIHGQPRLGAPLRFWDGLKVAEFIERHWMNEFAKLAGIQIQLPTSSKQVILQGQWNALSLGMALAEAGHYELAAEQLEDSLRASSFHLGNALLARNFIDAEKMVRAARISIQYDPNHYNQFFIAGYSEFLLGQLSKATTLLKEAMRLLDADSSDEVQRGPGFQERYLQSLGLLREIARRNKEPSEELRQAYRDKYRFLSQQLEFSPGPLGDWERPFLDEAACEDKN